MSGNSAVAGYLTPAPAPAPLEDDALEDFLHDVFAGLTGIDGKLIRPRWQPDDPNLPDFGTNWMAFGIMRQVADTYGYELHDPLSDTSDLQRHERVEVLISSYGPNSSRNLAQLRDGLQIHQNLEVLTANGIGVQETGEIITAPALIKDRWTHRYDMNFIFRRQVRREYSILSLMASDIIIRASTSIGEIDNVVKVNP